MAHDVFISHSHKDKTTADAVCAVLESSGVRCWIAPRDITPGLPWGPCIIEAIKGCRVMVLVFTTNANESTPIAKEVERGVNYGVVIVPFRVEDIVPSSKLEFFMSDVNWLDALNPPLEAHLKILTGIVKTLLAGMPPRVAVQPRPHIEPVAVTPPIPDVDEPEPLSQENPDPPVTHSAGKGANIPWQFGDTMLGSGASRTRVEDEDPALKSSSEEAAFQTPSPSPQEPVPQSFPEAPSTAKTEGYRGASTLGNISAAGSTARITAGSAEITRPRWRSKTSLILIASGVIGAIIVLGLIYRSKSEAPNSTALQEQDKFQQPSIPSSAPSNVAGQNTQSSNPSDAGNSAPIDAKKISEGVNTYQTSCDKGDATDCTSLGDIYLSGQAVAKDSNRAAQLYQKACDGGGGVGCAKLGEMYEKGLGVAIDENRAIQLYQKSCDRGVPFACTDLGYMYEGAEA
jgi:TIR domain/Sel1 repeat